MLGDEQSIKPKFGGHETFPFRYTWLPKVISLTKSDKNLDKDEISAIEREMILLGAGKNMVRSMYHWAYVAGLVVAPTGSVQVTAFGKKLLSHLDPFLEKPESLWLLHWKIASDPSKATAWYMMFNRYQAGSYDEQSAIDAIERTALALGWKSVSRDTLSRDISCFTRSYTVSRDKRGGLGEDSLECPLASLDLIRPASHRGGYDFQRGPKPTLTDAAFLFALVEFWQSSGGSGTLSLESISHAPGSPGRVFLLDEVSVAERLSRIASTEKLFRWVETAGLQQIQVVKRVKDPVELLGAAA